ncbi:putative zinc transporter msc2 [Coemansia sp. RSA 521]|nr:putative zinc transporter msc2 [Coemansia sp. RSA 521]KAJ2285625.1 putative zinc transporter msc2 [Coemansia sp. RSA 355]
MSPPAVGKVRSRPPVISTIEEYDKSRARKRVGSGSHKHTHDHRGHGGKHRLSTLPVHSTAQAKQQQLAVVFQREFARAHHFVREILSDSESRSIFMFLLLNLSYMVVQIVYGYTTNSLGLISDAIHMLFDCMALAIGLIAAVMSRWPSDEAFTFGYGRIEILSGFANGVFLMLISVSIFFEAIERLLYPPEMNTQRLLLVSFGGLVVNLFGMFAFNGHHHHHHGSGCSHSHHDHADHKHTTHEHADHKNSHANHDHSDHIHSYEDHDHNEHNHIHSHHRSQNMQGVFLHVLADTLGSVGVIISTLLIQTFGWTGFDPLASIAIAGLIFASVVPLVRDSVHMLLLRLPNQSQADVRTAVNQITEQVGGVVKLTKVQFWPVTETQIVGIVHVTVNPDQAAAQDELPLCTVTVREDFSRRIHSIIRSNVLGLQDVFIHVDIDEQA